MIGSNPNLVSFCLLLLRCTIGMLLFIAGSGKVLGWFGGHGMEATIQGFSKMGISMPLAYLSSYTELIGGLLLIAGLLTRPAAFAIMINMLVAALIMLPNGFMGPTGAQTAFIFLVIDIVILIAGPMTYSFDALIFRRSR
jgi:putative oxidoreductase